MKYKINHNYILYYIMSIKSGTVKINYKVYLYLKENINNKNRR